MRVVTRSYCALVLFTCLHQLGENRILFTHHRLALCVHRFDLFLIIRAYRFELPALFSVE